MTPMTGMIRVWVEAEDAAGNTAVAGPYQVERLAATVYPLYLPLVLKD